MKRFLIPLLCAVLAVSCAKETAYETMSESSIKQKLIGKTWTAIKTIDYSIDGKVIDKSTSSDADWTQMEWTFLEDGRVVMGNNYISIGGVSIGFYFSIIENKLIFKVATDFTSVEVPYTIKRITNRELVVETQHRTDVENRKCSYSEIYFRRNEDTPND